MRDRLKIALGVIRQLGVKLGVTGVIAQCQQQRVAVGRRLGHDLRADDRGGSGPVVDQHLLRPLSRQPVGDKTRDQVGAAPRRERHHHANRLVRIPLRQRLAPGQQKKLQQRRNDHHILEHTASCFKLVTSQGTAPFFRSLIILPGQYKRSSPLLIVLIAQPPHTNPKRPANAAFQPMPAPYIARATKPKAPMPIGFSLHAFPKSEQPIQLSP